MDFTNIVTFKIHDKQYYLYYNLVKGLPIFDELKKSDNVETIEYPGEINHEEIQIVFSIINNIFNRDKKISISRCYRIYRFMKYLIIDQKTMNYFIEYMFKFYNYKNIGLYMIDNKCIDETYDMFSDFRETLHLLNIYLLRFHRDIIDIDKYLTKFLEYYCKSSGNMPVYYEGMYMHLCYIYQDLFKDVYYPISCKLNDKNDIELQVNKKRIFVAPFIKDKEYNLYDVVYNNVKEMIIGQ